MKERAYLNDKQKGLAILKGKGKTGKLVYLFAKSVRPGRLSCGHFYNCAA